MNDESLNTPEMQQFVGHAKDLFAQFPSASGLTPVIRAQDIEPVIYCKNTNCRALISERELIRFTTWASKLFAGDDPGKQVLVDALCPRCQKEVRGMVALVCLSCREVVSRFAPWRDAKSGFVYRPDTYYHVVRCPKCATPEAPASRFMIEYEAFCKEKGIQL